MNRTILTLLTATTIAGSALADIADFENLSDGDSASFVTGGLLFESNWAENGVFGPFGTGGAENGTNIFGWCGSDCDDGEQIITVTSNISKAFTLTSIDAGNLWNAEDPLGYRQGMSIELVGFLIGGGEVFASLHIVEDVFTTYELTGFENLASLQMATFLTDDGNPDPAIDNLVFTTTVPSPGALMPLAMGGLMAFRRKR